jgi:C4-dicarboxylate transporter
MNNFKYWLIIILFSLVPTYLVHILIKPMWGKTTESFTTATTIESVVTIFFLPLFLAIFHYFIAKKYKIKPLLFIVNAIIVLFCIWLSAHLHFENWANSIGNKLNPDNGTIEVIGFTRGLGYIISLIGLLIGFAKLKKQNSLNTSL